MHPVPLHCSMEKSWAHSGKLTLIVLVLSAVGITGCSTSAGDATGNVSSVQGQPLEQRYPTSSMTARHQQSPPVVTTNTVADPPRRIYSSAEVPLTPTSSNTATRIYSEARPLPPATPVPAHRGEALAPQDQGVSEADRALVVRVRQNIAGDNSLSSGMPNLKVLANDGKVTLQGFVKTQEEKQNLKMAAQKTPGVASVDDQVEVKPGPP
jgi:hypothetical protein